MVKRRVTRSRHPCRSGGYADHVAVAPRESLSKRIVLSVHETGTHRDEMAPDAGRYVPICHHLTAANRKSTR